ncbi:MAG: hypothetical protein HYU27_03385 [Acidobacteria bacterium]|nr:hypothetical protein [Acidobacteriota bacterium]
MSNALGVVDSETALVRVFPAKAARLGLRMIAGLPAVTIDGVVGTNYRIETSPDPSSIQWTTVLDLTLARTPLTLVLPPPDNAPSRYYRAVVP